jgi:hypothetical protein
MGFWLTRISLERNFSSRAVGQYDAQDNMQQPESDFKNLCFGQRMAGTDIWNKAGFG